MDPKTYLKISGINLIFLMIGIILGPLAWNGFGLTAVVYAQSPKGDAKIDSSTSASQACDQTKFECVSPTITTGKAAFGIVLANRMATDRLEVNGYEPLKLYDNMLKALIGKGILTSAEAQVLINNSKAEKPLRLQQ